MKRWIWFFAYFAFALLSVFGDGAYRQSSVHTMPFDGVVTYYRPMDDYFFMKASDGSGTWRVQVRDKRDTALLKTGSMITVADGETRENSTTRRVLKATLKPWQSVADDEIPMPPHRALSVAELYTHPLNTPGAEDLWGELVSCVGVVRDINRRQSITQLQVGDGNLSFQAATQSLGYTQTQLRTVLWGLVEEVEGPASLSSLFRYAAERMAHWRGIVSIHSSGHEPRLARSVSGSLLMILQEAVGNALTHGFATKVDVSIEFAGRELTLSICDNGVGFDTTRSVASGHYGLESMRERAAHIGGTLKIVSSPDNGTLVTATIPLQGES